MMKQNRNTRFLVLALVVAGCLTTARSIRAADAPRGGSAEVSRLLAEVKNEVIALKHDTDELHSWTRPKQVSWQSHAEKLTKIRGHVNQAGKLMAELNKAREGASPWQHQAIDRIYPLLKTLADNTQATIDHLNDNRSLIHFSPYNDYARANYDLAQDLAELVCGYVDYGNHEDELRRLNEELQVAAS